MGNSEKAPFRIAGYLPDYRIADYDFSKIQNLTDLIIFSAEAGKDGAIKLDRLRNTPWQKLQAAKTKYRVRLLLCIGGWERSQEFFQLASSQETRTLFAKSAVQLCLEKRLDGIDIDWEHPKNAREENDYADLLKTCHKELQTQGLLLSVTLAAWQKLPKSGFESVDSINLMAYDHTGKHSTFENAVEDVRKLQIQGAPAEKLLLGVPFYGRKINAPDTTLTYRQLVEKQVLPPESDEHDAIYFNGPKTIQKKTAYARDSGLGGIMIWELGQDAEGKNALLNIINSAASKK
ncbi:glycoside hydrolase family 18 protein [Telmatocola sphagniphila]|uniref:chitinase n=1 Tax=Telmatocola sphagniphila TaxID=1123043 RepID=A0A8E6B7D3_9BACT|nr:glycoside hydrolase family 18 protein [Telmatocola sphagniphila]QVL33252.1 glycoside hydrolase family 18 protein [Telmatocola sphagniphila]